MLRATNRTLLTLAGLVLLALGLAVLVGSFNLQQRWGFSLSSAWPFTGPDDVLLTKRDRTRWRDEGWWWPVVIAALSILVLLALWWLISQLRRRRLAEVLVDSGDGEGARLRARTLEKALTAEAESLEGVAQARAVLRGSGTQPRVLLTVTLDPHADPAHTLALLRTEALEHTRLSAGLDELPAQVHLRPARHDAKRVT
ncbi:alkaline shock response membrane anchor protein AmaP [Streptomyces sp. NPDC058534]|uniref:alkaline shock response membrane anchor protein AmaP n=1 Tax=Streptomyces sp. NPDC058534 TaxID=3346541 RepID=UPI00365ECAC2